MFEEVDDQLPVDGVKHVAAKEALARAARKLVDRVVPKPVSP